MRSFTKQNKQQHANTRKQLSNSPTTTAKCSVTYVMAEYLDFRFDRHEQQCYHIIMIFHDVVHMISGHMSPRIIKIRLVGLFALRLDTFFKQAFQPNLEA